MPGRQFALEMCRHSSDLPCSQSPCQKTKIREAGRCRSKFPVLFQLDPAPSFGALEGHMFEEVCSAVVFLCCTAFSRLLQGNQSSTVCPLFRSGFQHLSKRQQSLFPAISFSSKVAWPTGHKLSTKTCWQHIRRVL